MADGRSHMIIGIDVGGTFTDLVASDPTTGRTRLAKVPSTLTNQADGVLDALRDAEADLAQVGLIVHGTTTTTNAVLERKLARTGMITTRGFRDVLELGRRTRPQAYGMTGTFQPIIPRDLRLEAIERMDANGNVVIPLDEDSVAGAARQLIEAGCESVVIHFLHAYANPEHETLAGKIVADIWPNAHVTLGHQVLSESREFERGVTASVNAAVQPILERYITKLTGQLADGGYAGDLLVMNGNGGMVSARLVAKDAAKTVMSGPASGVKAAAYTAQKAGISHIITYDMGGTSTDVALVRDNQPTVSNEIEVEYAMPIHVPMVDVRTIGAGGGSIARINQGGLLEVGPESAGATPGPICYGKGGERPTISDANLLLGRLNPAIFSQAGTRDPIAKVREIFARELGDLLDTDAIGAADAVVRVANTKMAGAIRMVSISLGADPRDYALFAFGGAGPLHATQLARELGIPKVLVPGRPGITNALGCIAADLRHDFVQTLNTQLDKVDLKALHAIIDRQVAQGEDLIRSQNVAIRSIKHLFSLDMQFIGQTHVLRVALPDARPDKRAMQELFEAAYDARFRVQLPQIRANIVNVNTSVIGEREDFDLMTLADAGMRRESIDHARSGRRPVYFEGDWHDTAIYWRDHMPARFSLQGPAIIEQMDTTTVVGPGERAESAAGGNILISVGDPT